MLALAGAWNSHLDMQPCDEEGDPLPGSKTTRLWQVCSWLEAPASGGASLA